MNYNTYLSDTDGDETLGGGYTSASESIMTGGDLDSDFEMEGGYNSDELNEQVGGKAPESLPTRNSSMSVYPLSTGIAAAKNTQPTSPVPAEEEAAQVPQQLTNEEKAELAVVIREHTQEQRQARQESGHDEDGGYESEATTSLSDGSLEVNKNGFSIEKYNEMLKSEISLNDLIKEFELDESDKAFISDKIDKLKNSTENEEDKFRFKVKILAFIDCKLHKKTGANISVVKNTDEGETYEVKDIKLR